MNLSTATDHPYQQTLPQAGAGQIQSLLVFHLDERAYGVSIEFVVQIIPMLKLTPVPQVEQVIEGVANIHGKVVPVMNVRRHLGLPPIPTRLYTPIILLRTGERMMGLIVDEVADVTHVTASQVTMPEAILPEGYESAAVLSGVVYQGDKAIIVLDPRFLLYPTQLRAVSKAIKLISKTTDARKSSGAQKGHAEPVTPQVELVPGENGDAPESDLLAPVEEIKIILVPQPDQPCPEGDQPVVEAQASTEVNSDVSQMVHASSEESLAPVNGSGNGAEPQNGKNKPRRKRRKLEVALAGEIASLAIDLPPSEGEPQAPPENTPVSPDSDKSSDESSDKSSGE